MALHSRLVAPLLVALTFLFTTLQAFEVTFPSTDSSCVTCKENTLKWTTKSTEPKIFSVALLNTNHTILNGNYQVANSLPSVNGTAKVQMSCVPATDGYYLLFVNSSKYSLDQPEVYYTSPTFSIKPNTSEILNGTDAKFGSVATAMSGTPSAATADVSTTSNVNASTANRPANPNTEVMQNKGAKDAALALQAASAPLAALVVLAAVSSLTLM